MMPTMLEMDAAQTAPATLPPAIDVNAIDDCTVEGNKVINNMPLASIGSPSCVRFIACDKPNPNSGNSAKVIASVAVCSRQFAAPAMIASRDSLAP